ncbi:NAD(P)/FAD-dependent oxidoreductase [Jiangella asiatica]|uniref:FAD-binding oxidoreductase n=1 Tax=Jiangella asiatica TaxID=2530372 RepID=A0A4R5DJN2_9ACTN|nr:FAD-binding oxidoreductase [Jiangella asiatica]TDE12171.1 FAD-binding oxidoreductase [Jiangella asiatica]
MAAETADAVVVGGGITGASIAFHLAARGLKRVVLCERDALCSGATGKTAAFVQVVETSWPEARITLASLRYYLHWDEIVGHGSCGFEQKGYLRVGTSDQEAKARLHAELLRSWGVDVDILDQAGVAELAPYLDTSDVAFGIYQAVAGNASATEAAEGFVRRAEQLGARLHARTPVRGIEVTGGRVSGVRTDRGIIAAPVVVLAAAGWNLDLLKEVGVRPPVALARTQLAQFAWPDVPSSATFVNVSDQIHGSYFTWDGVGRRFIAGLSADHRQAVDDLDHFDESGDDSYGERAGERLVARLPAAAAARRGPGWAGPVTLTPDRAMIVDRHPELTGLHYIAGCNGRGFKGAPALGRAVAEWVVDGAPRTVDLRPFSAERFTHGGPFERDLEYSTASAEFDVLLSRTRPA